LVEHKIHCQENGPQRVKYPEEGKNWIQFDDLKKMLKLPFCIYADFETNNIKIQGCEAALDKASTTKKTHHEVTGFTFVTVSPYYKTKRVTFRGKDAGTVFLKKILQEENRLLKIIENKKEMVISNKEEIMFQKAKSCHICNEKFCQADLELDENGKNKGKGYKVRDHCHFTGKYRGAAHNICNLNYRTVREIPVFFHNLSGYDGHIIFQNLCKVQEKLKVKVIAKTIEKFITFSIGKLQFKDTLQFLPSSLEKLVKNLRAKAEKEEVQEHKIEKLKVLFNNLYNYFEHKWSHLPQTAFEMLTRKLVYPYSYMDGFDKFKETELPPKEAFKNDLTNQHISQEDYEFVNKLWKTFGLQNLGELHDLYMDTDVYLLTDIFENFRKFSLEKYGLDAAHFCTAPSLSWSAALKHTKIKLELPTDPDMHIFFDRGLTGGISIVANHYARANNSELGNENYDPNKENSYINLFDCNNQYGDAMRQFLPTHGFEWMELYTESTEFWTEFVLKQKDEQDDGYMFEVDLEYPTELHDKHDNFPLAPEHLDIKAEMLSAYQKDLAEKLKLKVGGEKLCLTLNDKHNYICHYRNLKMYLEMGLKLKKVHKVLTFKQSAWLKTYIDLNTKLRQAADNDAEKDFAKLMNNSFFGKTCQDVRKYKDVKIVMDEEKSRKLIARPTLKQLKVYDENLVAIQLKKSEVVLNKPRYIGMAILDISKIVMYRFHYDFMMKKYPGAKLMFTDTDSFCYWIPTDSNIYEDIKGNSEWFDFSNFSKDHPNFDDSNKLVPGKFKDEMGGQLILEFAGLRSKMYSIKKCDGQCKSTAKGVLKCVKDNVLTHEDYCECLFQKREMRHKMTKIMQENHEMYTVDTVKTSLSPFNDKKWISREGDVFTSYSFGHHKIVEEELMDCLTDLANSN
jgi:hypothetical protein